MEGGEVFKPLIPRVYLLSFCSLSTALPEFSAGSRPEEVVAVLSKLHTETVPAQHNTRHKANVRQTDGR